MSSHGIYSLKSILDNTIDPEVCKQILTEIKSPLLQQSFIISTDDERSHSNMRKVIPSYNMPSNTKKHNYIDHSSRFNEWEKTQQYSKMEQSILTPFHPEIRFNLKQNTRKQENLCGSIFDFSTENRNQMEIQPKREVSRRKIFQNDRRKQSNASVIQRLENDMQRSQYAKINTHRVSLDIAILNVRNPELKQFLEFLRNFYHCMKQIQNSLNAFSKNLTETYQVLNSYRGITPKQYSQYERVLRRFRVNSQQQLFHKFLTNRNGESINRTHYLQQNIENTLNLFSNCQDIISQYISRPNIVSELKIVYAIIQQNFGVNLNQKIINMLHRISVQELDQFITQENLNYIWHQACAAQFLLQSQFIEALCKNQYIFRQQESYENILKQQGFERVE